jgi:chemotaxis protein MotB
VLRYLVEGGGVPAGRVFAAGYGDTRPVSDNGTPTGRAANRRADIVILYPNPTDATAATPAASATTEE